MQALIKSKDGHKDVNLNRRKAIHERCLNCSGWIPSEVSDCTLKKCALHLYRSGKGSQNASERRKAIREYCLHCMNGQVGEVKKCSSHSCPLYLFRVNGMNAGCTIRGRSDTCDDLDENFKFTELTYSFI